MKERMQKKVQKKGALPSLRPSGDGKKEMEDEIKRCFSVFDKQGKGYILTTDLSHILTTIGEKLTGEELEEMLNKRPEGGDRDKITFEQFVKMLMAK